MQYQLFVIVLSIASYSEVMILNLFVTFLLLLFWFFTILHFSFSLLKIVGALILSHNFIYFIL